MTYWEIIIIELTYNTDFGPKPRYIVRLDLSSAPGKDAAKPDRW